MCQVVWNSAITRLPMIPKKTAVGTGKSERVKFTIGLQTGRTDVWGWKRAAGFKDRRRMTWSRILLGAPGFGNIIGWGRGLLFYKRMYSWVIFTVYDFPKLSVERLLEYIYSLSCTTLEEYIRIGIIKKVPDKNESNFKTSIYSREFYWTVYGKFIFSHFGTGNELALRRFPYLIRSRGEPEG